LELIEELGSIRRAAMKMGMAYKHTWDKLKSMQATFGGPMVETRTGGAKGGGSGLTDLGKKVVSRYRAMEQAALNAALPMLRDLESTNQGEA
jgi:molybdate transport system regulatory protein